MPTDGTPAEGGGEDEDETETQEEPYEGLKEGFRQLVKRSDIPVYVQNPRFISEDDVPHAHQLLGSYAQDCVSVFQIILVVSALSVSIANVSKLTFSLIFSDFASAVVIGLGATLLFIAAIVAAYGYIGSRGNQLRLFKEADGERGLAWEQVRWNSVPVIAGFFDVLGSIFLLTLGGLRASNFGPSGNLVLAFGLVVFCFWCILSVLAIISAVYTLADVEQSPWG